MTEETRVVNPETGGMKGSKPCQPFWVDSRILEGLGDVAGFGATKYAPHNYRCGVNVSLHMNAAYRHIFLFQGGEDIDPESGIPHLFCAMWNLGAAWTQTLDHPELDDRWKPEPVGSVQPTVTPVVETLRYLDGNEGYLYSHGITPEVLANEKLKMQSSASEQKMKRKDVWRYAPDLKGRDV